MTRQPENFLYNDNTYQLPGPAHLLTGPSSGGLPGPRLLDPDGSHGPRGEVKSPREWLLLVIWRQKWLIAATMAMAGLAAVAYLVYATPMYTSTARVYVQPMSVSVSSGGGQGFSGATSLNYLNTQKEVVTSEPVLAIASTLEPVLKSEEMRDPRYVSDPIAHLKKVITAEVDKTNDLILVSAFCASGRDAEALANAVVDAYKGFQTRSTRTINNPTTGDTLEVLNRNKAEVESAINLKIQKLHDMEDKWGVLRQQDDHTNIIFRRLQALSEALTNAQAEYSEAKMAFDEAALSYGRAGRGNVARPSPNLDEQDIPITNAAEMTVLRSEMLQTQTLLQELEQKYLPEHPAILTLRRRLGGLNRAYVAAIERRMLSAKARVADLQTSYNDELKRATDLDSRAADYARVQEDLNRDKGLRDSFEAKIRDIQLSREAGTVNIEVLERAQAGLHPSWPSRTKTMAVAMAIGLSLGLLLACMREWVDDRFRSAGEIKSSLGMPLLAVIPQSSAKRSPSVSGQRILLDPASDTAEAYRALRAAILYSAPAGELKTLLVTSPSSGDGKTTLVSNLAIAMAQGGRRVVVVDADLRNPSQHDIFGVKNNTGLSALLSGRCSLETAVQRSHVPNLEILPCGPTPANPAEILNSREFGEVLETLSDKYDCVILDSPPVEAVADARIIAASCDATLIVLKAQTAHRRTTEHTRDALTSVGAQVLGVVVNDLPRRTKNTYGKSSAATRRMVPGLSTTEQEAAPIHPK